MSTHPLLKKKKIQREQSGILIHNEELMSIGGTMKNVCIALFCTFIGSILTWLTIDSTHIMMTRFIYGLVFIGLPIITFLIVCAIYVKPSWSVYLTPLYALFQGISLTSITFVFEILYPGIALQTLLATTAVILAVLFIYNTKMFIITSRMRRKFYTVLLATCILSLFNTILFFFGYYSLHNMLRGSGFLGIGFSIFMIGLASFRLLDNLQIVEECSEYHTLPKYMNWYFALAILSTVVWLYLEVLHLLAQTRKRS